MSGNQRHWMHTFDIDNHLNRITPRPRLYILPKPISHWFGYRAPVKGDQKQKPVSVLLVWFFSFIGAFIGISIIENVFLRLPRLDGHPVPIVIASFGAAAILEYNTIESPLSQPRNLILGHLLSAAVGVAITKLFHLLPEARFEDLRWVAGALAVGSASTVMSITKTVHPPAGATALLAATSPEMTDLGWWLLILVLLASCLMLSSAMIVNNLYKRFPLYWWTPVDLSKMRNENDIVTAKDAEKADSGSSIASSEASFKKPPYDPTTRHGSDAPAYSHREAAQLDEEQKRQKKIHSDPELKIQIELDRIVIPDWMNLSQWEAEILEQFQSRLKNRD